MEELEDELIEKIERCLTTLNSGNRDSAIHDLVDLSYSRLTKLVAKALKKFPTLQRSMSPEEIVQSQLLKSIDCAIHEVRPQTAQHLLSLVSRHIRYQLLSLIRKQKIQSERFVSLQNSAGEGVRSFDQIDTRSNEQQKLKKWERFQEKVDELPEDLRTVIDLIYFQGLSQKKAAEVLDVTDRTIRNRINSASEKLKEWQSNYDFLD
jgi:RNA polymerase sigma factor (sigma-70 family)